MYALAIIDESGTGDVADTLAEHFARRGTVGRITHNADPLTRTNDDFERDPGRARSDGELYRLSDDGTWSATGESLSLDAALDRLAPVCDYAIVEGYEGVDLPTVVVGNVQNVTGDVLVRVSSAEQFSVESVVDALAPVDPYETLESLIHRAKQSANEEFAGAIATFTGRVRTKEHETDDPTEHLEFERYDDVAAEKMVTIREELESRDGVYEVLLHHKTGVIEAGEDIVFVVVLAGHREEAFRTVEDGINRLKEEVPLFKKEVTVNDEFWAHTGRPD